MIATVNFSSHIHTLLMGYEYYSKEEAALKLNSNKKVQYQFLLQSGKKIGFETGHLH